MFRTFCEITYNNDILLYVFLFVHRNLNFSLQNVPVMPHDFIVPLISNYNCLISNTNLSKKTASSVQYSVQCFYLTLKLYCSLFLNSIVFTCIVLVYALRQTDCTRWVHASYTLVYAPNNLWWHHTNTEGKKII